MENMGKEIKLIKAMTGWKRYRGTPARRRGDAPPGGKKELFQEEA
jgi:hypothetical protein